MSRLPAEFSRLDAYPWRTVLATRYGDQDPNQHINNVAITRLFEEGRVRFGYDVGGLDLGDAHTVVASLTTNFLDDVLYPVDITLALGFARIGRTSWVLIEGAFDGERCLAVCEAVMVGVGPSGPVEAPAKLRALAERYRMLAGV